MTRRGDQPLLPIRDALRSVLDCNIPNTTLYRWINQGCRGVRLESVLVGGRRYASIHDVQRFIDEQNPAAANAEINHLERRPPTSLPGRRTPEREAVLRSLGLL